MNYRNRKIRSINKYDVDYPNWKYAKYFSLSERRSGCIAIRNRGADELESLLDEYDAATETCGPPGLSITPPSVGLRSGAVDIIEPAWFEVTPQ